MIARHFNEGIEKILPIFNARVCVEYSASVYVYDPRDFHKTM